jgi:hypothetical protein
MRTKLTEQELLNRLARLPRKVAPRHDPWLKIAARLDASETSGPARTAAPGWLSRAVAAVAVAAAAAGIVFSGPDRSAQPAPPEWVAAPPIIAVSEAEYLAALREFQPVGAARDDLSDQTVQTIENSWSALVRAEEALRTALAENPDDAFLNQRMLELRSRQLGFLKRLAVLDHSNRRMST